MKMSSLTPAEVKKFKVVQLREELGERDLDTKGKKAQLQKRLLKAIAEEAAAEPAAEPESYRSGSMDSVSEPTDPEPEEEEETTTMEAPATAPHEADEYEANGYEGGTTADSTTATEDASAQLPPPDQTTHATEGEQEGAQKRSIDEVGDTGAEEPPQKKVRTIADPGDVDMDRSVEGIKKMLEAAGDQGIIDFLNKALDKGVIDAAELVDELKQIVNQDPEMGKVFVRNIPRDCTEEEFKAAFDEYGTVIENRLPMDRFTGMPKGFGFITYDSLDGAVAALQESKKLLKGRIIECNLSAKGRKTHGKGAGGRGRGRGGAPGGRRGGYGGGGYGGGGRGYGGGGYSGYGGGYGGGGYGGYGGGFGGYGGGFGGYGGGGYGGGYGAPAAGGYGAWGAQQANHAGASAQNLEYMAAKAAGGGTATVGPPTGAPNVGGGPALTVPTVAAPAAAGEA